MQIEKITAWEILDSRGNPTIQAEVSLLSGKSGYAAVPSGASTGSREALELRDHDANRYLGKGVLKAVASINGEIDKALHHMDVSHQSQIDETLIARDTASNAFAPNRSLF